MALKDKLVNLEDLKAVNDNMQDNLAPAYSSSSTYAVGAHVMYNGDYYVCNTAITTAEAWTAAHWTKVTVGGEASDLKSAIYNTGTINAAWEHGRIDTSGLKSNNSYDIRFADFYPVGKYRTLDVIFNFPANQNVTAYSFNVAQYSTNSTSGYIETASIASTDTDHKITLNANTKYIKVFVRARPLSTTVIDLDENAYVLMYWVDGVMAKLRDETVETLDSEMDEKMDAIVPFGDKYSQTSTSRSFTVTRSIASGEKFSIKVTKWTGATPSAINLYLSTDGTNFTNKAQVATINNWINYTADQAYAKFRVGLSVDTLTEAKTLELLYTNYHDENSVITKTDFNPYIYGKNILLGGASIVAGYGGTGYAMDGDTIIDISGTPEGDAYSTHGLWKRNTSGYCWANLFKSLCETEYAATVDNNACQGTDIYFWQRHASVLIPDGYDLFIYTHSSNDRNYTPTNARTHIREGLATLLAKCKSLGTQMIVLSPPPASKANEDTKQTTTWQCNEFIKEACNDLCIQYFDLHNEVISYYFNHGAISAGTYISDGLHPNDAMYYIMYFCYCWLLNVSPTSAYEQPPT